MLTLPELSSAMIVAVTWCTAKAIHMVVSDARYLAYLKKADSETTA
jgi:hypothetical protein